jgi:hypothetical protein
MKDPFNSFGALDFPAEFLLTFFEAAEAAARKALRKFKRPEPKRGLTLPPGIDTPLWNELVKQALPQLKKRGSKAQLARLLGLPRQRLQDCLKAKTACLDAERALFLLCWIAARQQGRDLTP